MSFSLRKQKISNAKTKSFSLKGGLNTEISSMERPPGELLVCLNYQNREGSYSGYEKTGGYEGFSGLTLPSELALDQDWWTLGATYTRNADALLNDYATNLDYSFACKATHTATYANMPFAPGNETVWAAGTYDEADIVTHSGSTWVCDTDGTTTEPGVGPEWIANDWSDEWLYAFHAPPYEGGRYVDWTQRYLQSTKIKGVGATTAYPAGSNGNSGPCYRIQIWGDDVYGFRNFKSGGVLTGYGLYKTDATDGWTTAYTTSPMETTVLTTKVRSTLGRFGNYNSNDEVMMWVDAVSDGFYVFDGTTVTHVTSGLLVGTAPTNIGFYEGRAFVVYPTGYVMFSEVGDPTAWSSATGNAGDLNMGEPVTGIAIAAGVLIFFTRKTIQIVRHGTTSDQFIFDKSVLSKTQGAIEDTVQTLFETVYFCSDHGVTRMVPSADTGGFTIEHIEGKVGTLFDDNKTYIHGSLVDIINRRYYVLFEDADNSSYSWSLIFTMHKGRVKGVGRAYYYSQLSYQESGINDSGEALMFCSGDTTQGYILKLESGTGHNYPPSNIWPFVTQFTTSYYHYGSPRHWKQFTRVELEVDCDDDDTDFTIGSIYDYGSPLLADVVDNDSFMVNSPETSWGSTGATWGSFTWKEGALGRAILYLQGQGTNMAITVATSSFFEGKHRISNISTDYNISGLRQ